MTALRLEIEVSTVDVTGDTTFVEARGPDGVQLGMVLRTGSLGARVGQRLAVTIEAQAAPSLRDRMGRSAPAPAEGSSATPPVAATRSPPSNTNSAQDASSMVMAAILGKKPGGSEAPERDVLDEMDALFGKRA